MGPSSVNAPLPFPTYPFLRCEGNSWTLSFGGGPQPRLETAQVGNNSSLWTQPLGGKGAPVPLRGWPGRSAGICPQPLPFKRFRIPGTRTVRGRALRPSRSRLGTVRSSGELGLLGPPCVPGSPLAALGLPRGPRPLGQGRESGQEECAGHRGAGRSWVLIAPGARRGRECGGRGARIPWARHEEANPRRNPRPLRPPPGAAPLPPGPADPCRSRPVWVLQPPARCTARLALPRCTCRVLRGSLELGGEVGGWGRPAGRRAGGPAPLGLCVGQAQRMPVGFRRRFTGVSALGRRDQRHRERAARREMGGRWDPSGRNLGSVSGQEGPSCVTNSLGGLSSL